MWFLPGRDISEDELSLYTENMKPLWKVLGWRLRPWTPRSGRLYRKERPNCSSVTDEKQ
jgi:hypothetical protein